MFQRKHATKWLFGLAVVMAAAAWLGWSYYRAIFGSNVPAHLKEHYFFVQPNTSFKQLVASLEGGGFILNTASFEQTATSMQFGDGKVKTGRYEVKSGMSNRALVTMLRGGQQAPLKIALHDKRMIEDVAGFLGAQLCADSAAFARVFTDDKMLAKQGYTRENILTAFIPNTYEVFWTASPEEFLERMLREHDKFWNAERLAKAKALALSPAQVYTLASIVEKETNANSEKSRVAGVYLNRLHKEGWRLEADPTVVFALKQFDLKRILNVHLAVDSPYNTYKNAGLPPGPIYMPSITTLDKVLDAERHNYMYFCAAPNNSGTHVFAETLAQHNANAAVYHRWLNAQ